MKFFVVFVFGVLAIASIMAHPPPPGPPTGDQLATCYSDEDCDRMCNRKCDRYSTMGVCSNYNCYCALLSQQLPSNSRPILPSASP